MRMVSVDPTAVDIRFCLNRGDVILKDVLKDVIGSRPFRSIHYKFHCVSVDAPHPAGTVSVYEESTEIKRLLETRDVALELKRWEKYDLSPMIFKCPARLNHRFQYRMRKDEDPSFGQAWGPEILLRSAVRWPDEAA